MISASGSGPGLSRLVEVTCAISVPGDAESMPTKEDALALVQGSSETER